jgi:uracil-DNA glycosylase
MMTSDTPERLSEFVESVASKRQRAYAALGLGMMLREKSESEVLTAGEPALESLEKQLIPSLPDLRIHEIGSKLSRADLATLDWSGLQSLVAECQSCEFSQSRQQTVFGSGNTLAKLAVIADPPSADEEADGQPLAGQAGLLFDAMLASLGFNRQEHVYLSNVLKCRPSPQREPTALEFAQCQPFLRRQLELLRPRVVLLTGRFAAKTVLGVEAGLANLRGKVHRITIAGADIPVVVTFDPAYLLRNPGDKAKAWADLCLLHSEMQGLDTL